MPAPCGEGDVGDSFYILETGRVAVSKRDPASGATPGLLAQGGGPAGPTGPLGPTVP